MFHGSKIKGFILRIVGIAWLAILFQSFFPLAAVTAESSHASGFTNLSALTERFSTDLSKDLTGKKTLF